MKRLIGNRYQTSVRALDNRNVFVLRFPGSDALMIGITAEGSTYISTTGLRKLRDDIDKHLALAARSKP